MPGQPVVYLDHSSLLPKGQSVLDADQIFTLGKALKAIHEHFKPAYGPKGDNPPPGAWYAMDVEFKFDAPAGQKPTLVVKQARPHPGRGK